MRKWSGDNHGTDFEDEPSPSAPTKPRLPHSAQADQRLRRRGASALEMAIVLPLLLLLVFGIIEFGRAIMVHQVLINSAREATRRAVVPGATDAQVIDNVSRYMTSAGITGYTVAASVDGVPSALGAGSSSITNAPSKSAIEVRISVPHSEVGWGVFNLIDTDRTFAAAVQMRKE